MEEQFILGLMIIFPCGEVVDVGAPTRESKASRTIYVCVCACVRSVSLAGRLRECDRRAQRWPSGRVRVQGAGLPVGVSPFFSRTLRFVITRGRVVAGETSTYIGVATHVTRRDLLFCRVGPRIACSFLNAGRGGGVAETAGRGRSEDYAWAEMESHSSVGWMGVQAQTGIEI